MRAKGAPTDKLVAIIRLWWWRNDPGNSDGELYTSDALRLSLIATYYAYLLGTLVWLARSRGHYLFGKSLPSMAFLSALLQWLAFGVDWCTLYAYLAAPASCEGWREASFHWRLFRAWVFFPLSIIFALLCRGMHLYFEVAWTASLTALSTTTDSFEDDHRGAAIAIVDAAKGEGWCRLDGLQSMARPLWRRLGSPRAQLWLRQWGAFLITTCIVVAHITVALAIACMYRAFGWAQSEALQKTIEMVGFWLSACVYMVVAPLVMVLLLRGVQEDAFMLQHDLLASMNYALPLYLLFLAFCSYDLFKDLHSIVNPLTFLWAVLALIHTATVTVPLLRTLSWQPDELNPAVGSIQAIDVVAYVDLIAPHAIDGRRFEGRSRLPSIQLPLSPWTRPSVERHSREDLPDRSGRVVGVTIARSLPVIIRHRPIGLDVILANDRLREAFEEYSKRAFVWDSVLFYRTVLAFRQAFAVPSCEVAASLPMPSPPASRLMGDAQRICSHYIWIDAPCKMNLSSLIVEGIRHRLFPTAHGEVVNGGGREESRSSAEDLGGIREQPVLDGTLFDEAQREVLMLLSYSTYRSFLYSLDLSTKALYMVPLGEPVADCEGHHRPALLFEMLSSDSDG